MQPFLSNVWYQLIEFMHLSPIIVEQRTITRNFRAHEQPLWRLPLQIAAMINMNFHKFRHSLKSAYPALDISAAWCTGCNGTEQYCIVWAGTKSGAPHCTSGWKFHSVSPIVLCKQCCWLPIVEVPEMCPEFNTMHWLLNILGLKICPKFNKFNKLFAKECTGSDIEYIMFQFQNKSMIEKI